MNPKLTLAEIGRIAFARQPLMKCACGAALTTENADFIGIQDCGDFGSLALFNCPDCRSSISIPTAKLIQKECA